MRILIDIGHPAHVHLFHYFADEMTAKGHVLLFTCRDKDNAGYLLQKFGLDYKVLGKPFSSKIGKIAGIFLFDFKIWMISLKFRPDIFLSHGSFYAAQVAALLRKPHIALEDTGNSEQVRLYLPFTRFVLTSSSFHKSYGDKQIIYNSYHELAYLHPARFKPNPSVLNLLGVKPGEPFFILRFISWNATHDWGRSGISYEDKIRLVEELRVKGKVFISSESQPDPELVKYQIPLPFEKMHDALAFAALYVGEGATMSSESAMLGTPAVYINPIESGTIDSQEQSGLLFHFRNFEGVISKITHILAMEDRSEFFREKRKNMLSEKTDLTAFLVSFFENWPANKHK